MIGQMMTSTSYVSNYYLYEFILKIISNKKIKESDETDNDVYILNLNLRRYTISTYIRLRR
jgi:hypothetical protein